MSKSTTLASGTINGADQLSVELVEPPDLPPAIVLRWPQKPSVTTPDAYANAAMQVLSAAVIELAAIVSGRRSCETSHRTISISRIPWNN